MNKRTGLLLVLVLAAAIAAVVASPVQILYASSGSMAPTINEGDLYVIVDSNEIERGDVIAFESSQYDQYVTHRVVDRVESGFVTQGDANPSTDQAGGHPPVRDAQIIGKVIKVAGRPMVVPGIGSAIAMVQSHRLVLLLILAGFVFLPELVGGNTGHDRPSRRVLTAGAIVHPLFVLAIATCFLLVFWGASAHEVMFVATAGKATASHAVPVGETAVKTIDVETYVPPFTTVIVDAHGMEVLERTIVGSTIELTVRVPAKETIGPYGTRVAVNAYPATLPRGLLESLDAIHWLVAATASMVPVFLPVIGVYLYAVDPGAPLRWPRNRWLRSVGGK